jgi:putative transposase
MPGGDPDTSDAHAQHTRARHDAPLRDPRKPPGIPRGALGQIVASYKSAVTRMAYRDGLLPHGTPVWQRNYWDRVIRDDGEHERIAQYIRDNPANWKGDRFNR